MGGARRAPAPLKRQAQSRAATVLGAAATTAAIVSSSTSTGAVAIQAGQRGRSSFTEEDLNMPRLVKER